MEIDNEIENPTLTIQSTLIKNFHSINQSECQINQLIPDIHIKIETKYQLRKNRQRTRDPILKRMLNAQIIYVRNLVKDYRQSEWDTFVKTLNFKDRSLYKLNRRLLHKTTANTPLKTTHELRIFDTEDKSELFANTIEDQFSCNPGEPLPEVEKSV